MTRAAVVLAAGQGRRMKSDLPKVLHPVAGRPMVRHVIEAARGAGVDRIVVVVGHGAEQVRTALTGVEGVIFAEQTQQLGTGHAVLAAADHIRDTTTVLVLPGDVPLIEPETLTRLFDRQQQSQCAAVVLTAMVDDPTGYGRIVRGSDGGLRRIVEEADAGPAERALREINTGLMVFATPALLGALTRIGRNNRQGEYYLVDVVPLLLAEGSRVETVLADDGLETMGVNDRVELARAGAVMRQRLLRRWMLEGVTIVDPATTFIDVEVRIGRDTIIEPFTVLAGRTVIGRRCHVGPGAQVYDSQIGDDSRVHASVVESSRLGNGVTVGPFNHLRPGTTLGDRVKIGNFVELKNTQVGVGSKVPHHSYVGDATLGRDVNIGAGVVTVNYDGRAKHRTEIGDGAFVGCNVNLIAPVCIGRGAYVAAGSTVDTDVPDDALAIARARQTNKEGWARRRREQEPDRS